MAPIMRPQFKSQHQSWNPNAWNPSTEVGRDEDQQGLLDSSLALGLGRDSVLKVKEKSDRQGTLYPSLASTHA